MLRPDWGWIMFFCLVLLFCAWVHWPILAIVTLWVAILTFVPAVRAFCFKVHSLMGPKLKKAFDWGFIILVSVSIVVGLKSFFVDVFRLPSNSMEKTIGNGDIILINKLILGPRMKPDDPDHYYRGWGCASIHRNDLIVFNFPEGDTLLVNRYFESYYSLKRKFGALQTNTADQFLGERAYKSVTRRPKYIKRVIALPGDTIEIQNGIVWVNHQTLPLIETSVNMFVDTTGKGDSLLHVLHLKPYNQYLYKNESIFEFEIGVFQRNPILNSYFSRFVLPADNPDPHVFPYHCLWNTDFYGPLVLPSKGMRVDINVDNIFLYARIIDVYENNDLEIRGNQVLINGKVVTSYDFKMNYYWVMGDNHPHSFDSRYWGFLPENHVIGVSPCQFHF